MFRFAHAAFLAVSLWIALDPPFSPRKLGLGAATPDAVLPFRPGDRLLRGLLPADRFGARPQIGAQPETDARSRQCIAKLTVAAFWVLLAALPLMLVWRNLGQIRTTNGPALRQFAQQLYRRLAGRQVGCPERRSDATVPGDGRTGRPPP